MSYTIQSIISDSSIKDKLNEMEMEMYYVDLPLNMVMIPLTYDFVDKNYMPFLPLTDEGALSIGEKLINLCKELSIGKKVVYIEAEFFGGEGTQACNLYENGKECEPPLIDIEAINHALKWLGIEHSEDKDEFSLLGLDAHRNTDGWIK